MACPVTVPTCIFQSASQCRRKETRKAGLTHTLAEAPAKRGTPSVLKGIAVARRLPVWCRYRIRSKTSYDTIVNRYKHNMDDGGSRTGETPLSSSPVENRTFFSFYQGSTPQPSHESFVTMARPPKRRRVMTKHLDAVTEVACTFS